MFQRCPSCAQLPSHPVAGGVRVVCRCGKTSVEYRRPVDIDSLKRLTSAALERARVRVHAVPIERGQGFTLSIEREPRAEAGLSESDARRYADAINGEADLARAMLQLLAELEELRQSATPPPKHGSGTMPRVTLPPADDGDDGEEKVG